MIISIIEEESGIEETCIDIKYIPSLIDGQILSFIKWSGIPMDKAEKQISRKCKGILALLSGEVP